MASQFQIRTLALFALAWMPSCTSETAIPPNILLISIDTLRADHLSCYGYERLSLIHI